MKAQIYRQAFDSTKFLPEIDVTDFSSPYTQIDCIDGCVDGLYELPDGEQMVCVCCRGTGKQWFNLY